MTQSSQTLRLQPCFAVTHGAASHAGLVRPTNQDSFLDRPELGLWAVADGIGGLAGGERASRAVVEALGRLPPPARIEEMVQAVEACLARVSSNLRWDAEMGEDGVPMGSTVVALVIQNRSFTCLWAGDSRLYRFRDGVLERLTTDHTSLQEILAAGHPMPPAERRRSLNNVLTRAVGTQALLTLSRRSGTVEPGDLFLLCSDGLNKVVDEPTVAALLRGAPRGGEVRRLMDAALHGGAPDNVTLVVVGGGGAGPAGEWPDGALGGATDGFPDGPRPASANPEGPGVPAQRVGAADGAKRGSVPPAGSDGPIILRAPTRRAAPLSPRRLWPPPPTARRPGRSRGAASMLLMIGLLLGLVGVAAALVDLPRAVRERIVAWQNASPPAAAPGPER